MSVGDNFVPPSYGRVGLQKVGVDLDEASIRGLLRGREVYFDTDYLILEKDRAFAIVRVVKTGASDLFSRIDEVEIVALPDSCRFVDDAEVDPGNPSALAECARRSGISASETLIVRGRYEHVSFIHRPRPLAVRVYDLSPPEPPRLLDMVRRVLAYADFPAVVVEAHVQAMDALAEGMGLGGRAVLYPCGVSELRQKANAFYLDERPPRKDWVLIGCERSRRIHRHVYGDDCPRVDLCPVKLFEGAAPPAIMRCCMVEKGFELAAGLAIVPWGVDVGTVERALRAVIPGAAERQ